MAKVGYRIVQNFFRFEFVDSVILNYNIYGTRIFGASNFN